MYKNSWSFFICALATSVRHFCVINSIHQIKEYKEKTSQITNIQNVCEISIFN